MAKKTTKKSSRGVKKGTKRGKYKKTSVVQTETPKRNLPSHHPLNFSESKRIPFEKPKPTTEVDGTNFGNGNELLDAIENVGKMNIEAMKEQLQPDLKQGELGGNELESFIDQHGADAIEKKENQQEQPEIEEEEEEEEEIDEEEEEEYEEEEENESSLNSEYKEDSKTYSESQVEFGNRNPNNDPEDGNNMFFSGSIIFVIWDTVMPGVIMSIYKMFANPVKKAKLEQIDADELALTDDQKEEIEKMGLATHLSKMLFEKMNPLLSFVMISAFFTTMNLKLKMSEV